VTRKPQPREAAHPYRRCRAKLEKSFKNQRSKSPFINPTNEIRTLLRALTREAH